MSDERSDLYEAGLKTRREVLGSGWVDPQMEKAKTDPFTAAIADLVNEYCWGYAWTRPGHSFSCDGMDVILPTNQKLLEAARKKNIPIIYTTTAYQDPDGPRSDAGLWGLKIPVESLL